MNRNIRTLRGTIQEGAYVRIILDDGLLHQGYKVTRFLVAPRNPASSAGDCFGILAMDYDASSLWQFDDNRQIAWAAADAPAAGGGSVANPFTLVDPQHVIQQELWVYVQNGAAVGTELVNYFVELQPVELTDDETIIALIKARSQNQSRD